MYKRVIKKVKKKKNLDKRNEKGLSTIVATLLIILLTLVAVGIIWVVIRNVIQSNTEQISLGKFTLDLEIKDVLVNFTNHSLNIKIKRNAGEGEISGLDFIVEDGDNTEVVESNLSLKELEERTINLPLSSSINISKIQKVSVAPIFKLESGKEVIGDVKDEYTAGPGGLRILTCTLECAGKNCGNDGCGGSCLPGCTLPQTCNSNGQCLSPTWQTGLISWWRFNGNALDFIGVNHGTVNGATLMNTGCKSGQCYSFDGVNDYINLPDSNLFDFPANTDFTVSLWASRHGVVSFGYLGLFSHGAGSDTTVGYDIRTTGSGADLFFEISNGTVRKSMAYINAFTTLNVLHHIAVVADRDGYATFYYDGSQVGVPMNISTHNVNLISDVNTIGNWYSYYWNGSIDEVMVWNKSLSSTEIQQLYTYSYN